MTGPTGNQLLPYDWQRPHPALAGDTIADAVADLARDAKARQLALMVDLVANQIAIEGPLADTLNRSTLKANVQQLFHRQFKPAVLNGNNDALDRDPQLFQTS